MRIITILLLGFFLVVPGISFATTPPPCDAPLCDVDGVISLITALVNYMQAVFWILAAASGLYAGILYLRSGGKPEMLKSAEKQLIYTVVAVAVAVMAYGIPTLVDSFLRLRA